MKKRVDDSNKIFSNRLEKKSKKQFFLFSRSLFTLLEFILLNRCVLLATNRGLQRSTHSLRLQAVSSITINLLYGPPPPPLSSINLMEEEKMLFLILAASAATEDSRGIGGPLTHTAADFAPMGYASPYSARPPPPPPPPINPELAKLEIK